MKKLTSLGLKYKNEQLYVLDQQKLPHEEVWIHCLTPFQMVELIQSLKIRGAPLIGVAAALALARYAQEGATQSQLTQAARLLRQARPTAVNLMGAVDRIMSSLDVPSMVQTAEALFEEDIALCEAIAEQGAVLIKDGDQILTHCNSGGLATAGVGTALGIIRRAFEQGKKIHVYVDETRPVLQGSRLTTWELNQLGVPHTLICDNMAAFLMKQKKIKKIFVGADRIARNGDFANKVGTYSIAVQAHYHQIPFYVAAPYTTIDLHCATGDHIPIEERSPEEVRFGQSLKNCAVYNPAFDVTPRELVSGWILDRGVYSTFLI